MIGLNTCTPRVYIDVYSDDRKATESRDSSRQKVIVYNPIYLCTTTACQYVELALYNGDELISEVVCTLIIPTIQCFQGMFLDFFISEVQ